MRNRFDVSCIEVQSLICVIYNKLVIPIRLIFKTSNVRQLFLPGTTSREPRGVVQWQRNGAPNALLSYENDAGIHSYLYLSVAFRLDFGGMFQP